VRSVPPRDSHIQHYIRTTELALQKTHEAARQVGKPVATQALKDQKKAAEEQVEHHILSDCPLAADHLHQVRNCSISFGCWRAGNEQAQLVREAPESNGHSRVAQPIELLAMAYRAGRQTAAK
jgi:hypothetical protein